MQPRIEVFVNGYEIQPDNNTGFVFSDSSLNMQVMDPAWSGESPFVIYPAFFRPDDNRPFIEEFPISVLPIVMWFGENQVVISRKINEAT